MRTNHRWPFWALLSLLAVSIFAFSACNSEENDPLTDTLSGKWVLESVSGGFSGKGYTPTFNTLYFVNSKDYQLLNGDTLKAKGTYLLYEKDKETWIEFTSQAPSPVPFEDQDKKVEADKSHLILSDPCCDLFVYHFDKDNN